MLRLAVTLVGALVVLPGVSAAAWRRAERLAGLEPSLFRVLVAAGLGPCITVLPVAWGLFLWPGAAANTLLALGLITWAVIVVLVARPWRRVAQTSPGHRPPAWPLVLAMPIWLMVIGQNILYPIVENDAAFLTAQAERLAEDRDLRQFTDGPDPRDGFLSPRYPLGSTLLQTQLRWAAGAEPAAIAVRRAPPVFFAVLLLAAVYVLAWEQTGSAGWATVGMLFPLTARSQVELWLTNQKEPILEFLLLTLFGLIWTVTQDTKPPVRRAAWGLLVGVAALFPLFHESALFVVGLGAGLLAVLGGARRWRAVGVFLGAAAVGGALPWLVERVAETRYTPGAIWQMPQSTYVRSLLSLMLYHAERTVPEGVWWAKQLGVWTRPVQYSTLFWFLLILPWWRPAARRFDRFDLVFAGPVVAMWLLCADPFGLLADRLVYAPVLYLLPKYQMLFLPVAAVWVARRLWEHTDGRPDRGARLAVALTGSVILVAGHVRSALKGPLRPTAAAWQGQDIVFLGQTTYSVGAAWALDPLMNRRPGAVLTFDPARTYLLSTVPSVSVYDRRVAKLFEMTSLDEAHTYLWHELGVTHVLASAWHFVPANDLWHDTPLEVLLRRKDRADLIFDRQYGLIYRLRPPQTSGAPAQPHAAAQVPAPTVSP